MRARLIVNPKSGSARAPEFVPLMSERLHVFVRFPEEYAIITIENRQERLLRLPPRGRTLRFALLERWLTARAASFFPGRETVDAFPFKIIRDAGIQPQ